MNWPCIERAGVGESDIPPPFAPGDLRGRRVLVTGGKGFIGGHLVPLLSSIGAEVTTASRAAECYPGLSHSSVDFRDPTACERTIAAVRPDIIYHLAGSRDRTRDVSLLRDAFDTNVFATANLFCAAAKVPTLQTIVVLGSSEEYGAAAAVLGEGMREAPVSVYSLSKVCATQFSQFMNRVHNVPCVIVRPSVVYGPGQDEDMFLPALVRALAAGDTFPMTPGHQTRDFIYVSDLADALVRVAACTDGQILNVGSGIATPITEVAMKVGRLLQREHLVQIGALEYRTAEIMHHSLDIFRANRVLDWRPCVTLDQGLATTVRAHLETLTSK